MKFIKTVLVRYFEFSLCTRIDNITFSLNYFLNNCSVWPDRTLKNYSEKTQVLRWRFCSTFFSGRVKAPLLSDKKYKA